MSWDREEATENLADAFHLFLYGDQLKEYPGWQKKGKTWVYNANQQERSQVGNDAGAGQGGSAPQ